MNYLRFKLIKVYSIAIFLAVLIPIHVVFPHEIYAQQEDQNTTFNTELVANENKHPGSTDVAAKESLISKEHSSESPVNSENVNNEKAVTIKKTNPAEDVSHKATKLKSVSVEKSSDGLDVKIESDGMIKDYNSFVIKRDISAKLPARIVFDILNLTNPLRKEQSIPVNTKWISKIRYYASSDKLRIVLDTKNEFLNAYTAKPVSNGLLVSIGSRKTDKADIYSKSDNQNKAVTPPAALKNTDKTEILPNINPVSEAPNKKQENNLSPALVDKINSTSEKGGKSTITSGTTKPVESGIIIANDKFSHPQNAGTNSSVQPPKQNDGAPVLPSGQVAGSPEQPQKQVAKTFEQPQGQGINPVGQPQVQTAQIAPAQNRSAIARGSVALNFDDADVYEVIQTIFGQVLRVNYIVDPNVKGRVTFRSTAPVAQNNILPLMEVILRLNGIAVVEESGLYRIVPINNISKEPAAVQLGRDSNSISLSGKALLQVVPVRYMQSSDLIELLKPFLSENAVVIDVPMSNQIIIADTDANVKRVLKLVEIFDNEQQKKKGPQVFVYPVQNGKAKDIAAQLQQIFLGEKPPSKEKTPTASNLQTKQKAEMPRQVSITSIGSKEAVVSSITRIYSDETLNAIIVLSTPEDYEIIKDAIAKIDLVPRQVMIEGMVASIVLKDNLSLGLAWSINTNAFGGSPANISLNPSSLDPANFPGTGLRFVGTDSGGTVRAVVSALAEQSKAKLLAAPHILVSDNREASIQIGQQVPIVTSETFGSTTVAPQRTIQYKDIGIILKVKPQVNDSGLVSLDIKQEISSFETIRLSAIQDDIILNKTEASTNLVVQDGHTIIIGGLIREDKTKSRTGIPWLSKIPLLGFLFGDTLNDQSRTEIIILLTPHVLKNQNEAKSLTNSIVDKFTKEDKGGINKQELINNIGAGENSIDKKGIEPIK